MKRVYLLISSLFLALNLIAADTKTIIDMGKREVLVPKTMTGIITIGGTPAINAFLIAFKKGDIIHNGVENTSLKKMPFWKHQEWFIPKLFSMPQVSSNPPSWTPIFEKIAQVQFDIALVNNASTADLVQKRGIKTAIINWKGEESIQKSMTFLGELFEMQDHAKAYNDYYADVVTKIRQKTASLDKRKSALYVRLDNLTLPMVSTANALFDKAGGVAKSAHIKIEHVSIDMEKLFVLDPDILFVWGKKDLKLAYKDPKFRNLRAVKNKQVYAIPMGAHFWTHYTPEQALAIQWVAQKMYPDLFRDLDMHKETKEFYQKFMGTTLSSQQIDEILRSSLSPLQTP